MARLSELPPPAMPLSGLELIPVLQGGGLDGNVGMPILSIGAPFGGQVLVMRAPVLADMTATADADPGAGKVRWNHATPTSATQIFIDDVDEAAEDLAAALAALQPGGFLYFQGREEEDRDNWQKWQVTSVTDASGYTKVSCSLQLSNGAFADGDELEMVLQQPPPSPGVDRNIVTAAVPSAGVVPIDCALGDYHTLAPTAAVTGWSFTNVPPACSILVKFTQHSTPVTVAWPASFRWAAGTDGVVSTGSGAIDMLALTTFDGGATWLATLANGFAP
ncbi:hypothetical protein MMG85_11765 [Pseudoxanthomonas sp. LH2527]|uniref:hypothetical protein n=1 Tax=Pseudoxanthomonas sp. LH2527 TaxID=2923249 RepID=UPI001F1339F5|nr:hypothetical protein [Pseudoxanthomonas sp. LH2527]MCH6484234.1 hypothetical protein [Pseudoxanthomonas sp. LH2527]